jgi:hypothetical protein
MLSRLAGVDTATDWTAAAAPDDNAPTLVFHGRRCANPMSMDKFSSAIVDEFAKIAVTGPFVGVCNYICVARVLVAPPKDSRRCSRANIRRSVSFANGASFAPSEAVVDSRAIGISGGSSTNGICTGGGVVEGLGYARRNILDLYGA